MSKADVWMPLYIGDYLRDTRRLSLEQHGAYVLLLMEYWISGPLPDDDMQLARLVGCSHDAWSMLRASLKQYFSVSDGHWFHKRVDAEREKAAVLRDKRKTKAERAAEARWSKRDDAPANASGTAKSNAPSIASSYPQSPSQPQSHIYGDGDESAGANESGLAKIVNKLAAVTGLRIDPSQSGYAAQIELVRKWKNLGASDADIVGTVTDVLSGSTQTVRSLNYFDVPIHQAVTRRENQSNGKPDHNRSQPEISDPLVRAAVAREARRRAEEQD